MYLRVTPCDLRRCLNAGQSAADDQHAAVRTFSDRGCGALACLGSVERVRVSRGAGDGRGVRPAARGVYKPVEHQRLTVAERQLPVLKVDTGDRPGQGRDPGTAEDARAAARTDGLPGGDLMPPGPFLPGNI